MRKDKLSVKNVRTINVRTGEVKESRIQTTTPDERPNIWNLQAFAIVFLFIMLGTTINVYSVNNDNLTWVDSNGDFKLDSYNHSMINLDTDLLELNNQSLNDVFLDGNLISNHDFSNGIAGWYFGSSITNVSVIDEELYFTGSGNVAATRANHVDSLETLLLNHNYYINFQVRRTNSNISNKFQVSWRWYNVSVFDITEVMTNYSLMKIGTISESYTLTFGTKHPQLDVVLDNIYMIDLTDLGIDNLTQAQMDSYYDLYVSLQENRIEAYKDLGNQPISQWQNLTQHLQLVIDAIMGPIDNISDWINKFMNGLFS